MKAGWKSKRLSEDDCTALCEVFAALHAAAGGASDLVMIGRRDSASAMWTVSITEVALGAIEPWSPGGWHDDGAPTGPASVWLAGAPGRLLAA